MDFKKNIFMLSSIAMTFALANPTQATNYPNGPIKLIVPWPAGGSADALGRLLGERLGRELKTNIIVENVAGASGIIGTQQFIRAKPDGYTLLLATSSGNVSAPNLFKKITFDPIKDFSPIGIVASIPSILIVSSTSSYTSPKEIVDEAKKHPDTLSYGSGGIGNSGHLTSVLFSLSTDIKAHHIPYKGNNPALTDLIGERLDYMFDNGAIPHIKGNKVKALAVTSHERIKAMPEIPTFKELGFDDVILSTWFGLAAPAKTPENIINEINSALNNSLQDPIFSQRLIDMGAELRTTSSQEFSDFWVAEFSHYKSLIEKSGATAE